MAQTYELEAQPRTLVGKKVGRLRREGLVPVGVYGAHRASLNLQIPYRALQVTLMHAGGTHLINLKVGDHVQTVVAREVHRDPVRRNIIYVDFVAVDKDTRLTSEVPVHFVGESPVVEAGNGLMITGPSTLKINALATNMPEYIEVDISKLLKVGDAISVGDLTFPEGAISEDSPEEMIARIVPVAVVEEETVEGEDISAEPEVIKKGKIEEEEIED